MSTLLSPFTVKSVTLRNRIGVSPMCQYSSKNGMANDWHLVHLGSRASGGAALVMAEATAVSPEGRITLGDAGIWGEDHIEPLQRITRFIKGQGAVPGIQIAHAGRKASAALPQDGGAHLSEAQGGWTTIGPSPIAFGDKLTKVPREMNEADILAVKGQFASAAARAIKAGYEWLEIHAAHGYLLHEFLSPLSNHRTDAYGGSFDNRVRLVIEVTREVRSVWPEQLPLAIRFSCTDWAQGGWDIDQTVELSRRLKTEGVDLIDCSSGALVPGVKIPEGPDYQVPFAERIRREAGIATAAVGLITTARRAEAILASNKADLVYLARAFLRDPYWAHHAARELGEGARLTPPVQYARAF